MSFVEAIEGLASIMGVEVPRSESDRPARRYDELVYPDGQRRATLARAAARQPGRGGVSQAARHRRCHGQAIWNRLRPRWLEQCARQVWQVAGGPRERLLATGLIIRKDNGKHYDRFRERIMFPDPRSTRSHHRLWRSNPGRW